MHTILQMNGLPSYAIRQKKHREQNCRYTYEIKGSYFHHQKTSALIMLHQRFLSRKKFKLYL